MATILIDPVPAPGHYNGSLRLANILRKYGHKVVYVGVPAYQERIENEGYPFYSVGYLINKITKDFFLRYWLDSFISLFSNTCLKGFLQIADQYDAIIEKVKPDLILLDVLQIHKSVIYGKYNVRVIGFDIMVASAYAPNVPPCYSTFIPQNNFISAKYVDWLWFLYDSRKLYRKYLLKMLYFGNDLISIYHKIGQINQVPLEKWNAVKRICSMKIVPCGFYELILTPQCVDFPRPLKKNIIHIEPFGLTRDESDFSERYVYVRDAILALKQTHPDMKFIYVSIGTISGSAPKREARFIRVLIDYCRKYNDCRFVFSIGNNFDISTLKSVPESLYIFNHVPQLDVLNHCDFMITHGGMNSLTECIINEVPVIVYPLMTKPNWDQNGNATRVVYHRIGLRGKISTMAPASLRKKINEMCLNYAFYKRNMKAMHEKLNMETAPDRAIKIMETLLNKTEI